MTQLVPFAAKVINHLSLFIGVLFVCLRGLAAGGRANVHVRKGLLPSAHPLSWDNHVSIAFHSQQFSGHHFTGNYAGPGDYPLFRAGGPSKMPGRMFCC
jgi:hypothetical protein